MSVLRDPLLVLSRSGRTKRLVESMPVSGKVVRNYVPGETIESAVEASAALIDDGLQISLDYLGEDTTDETQAKHTVDAYLTLLDELGKARLTHRAEVSVKLSAVGQALPGDGDGVALENARSICRAARNAGSMVTIDMEDHTLTDRTLETVRELRKDFPETGTVLQSMLRRTESDCRELAYEGSRIRLCKGAYAEPEDVAYGDRLGIDKSYVRCLKVLLGGHGYPMIATHDPRMVEIGASLACKNGRSSGTYEFQMLYGIRSEEQKRLAGEGETVRIYMPYGEEWYGYLMRRLAERPQNLAFFARSLVSKK